MSKLTLYGFGSAIRNRSNGFCDTLDEVLALHLGCASRFGYDEQLSR